MSGLIEEIQSAVIDKEVSTGDLLRRVKIAASKLKLSDTIRWVDDELNGYRCPDEEIPTYRTALGKLLGTDRFGRVIAARGDPKTIEAVSLCYFRESVGALESLLSDGGNNLSIPIDARIAASLRNSEWTYHVAFSRNVLVGITESVRSMVLDWSLGLEAQGIIGEGISFSMDEKAKAQLAAQSITIHNYGPQSRTNLNSLDQSNNIIEGGVFNQVQAAIDTIANVKDREHLTQLNAEMQEKAGTSAFREVYNRFLTTAATYMTILSPFLPALSAYLPG